MPDCRYKLNKLKRGLLAEAAREAVLEPLGLSRPADDTGGLAKNCRILIIKRRARLEKLRDRGYGAIRLPLNYAYARNCPPPFFLTSSHFRCLPCNLLMCPFCQARQIEELYACFWEARKPSDHLLAFSTEFVVPARGCDLLAYLQQAQERSRGFIERNNSLIRGGWWAVTAEPYRIGQELQADENDYRETESGQLATTSAWRFCWRFAGLLTDGPSLQRLPLELTKFEGLFDPHKLTEALATVCAYPAGLLNGSINQTIELLNLRKNHKPRLKLSNRVGCLRKERSDKVPTMESANEG